MWRSVVTCLHNVRVSSAAAQTNRYNFSPTGRFYVSLVSPATTELNWILHLKRSIFCPILTKFHISRNTSIKGPQGINPIAVNKYICIYIYIKFDENPSSGCRADTCGQTDRRIWQRYFFYDYANASKTHVMLWRSHKEECDEKCKRRPRIILKCAWRS
jgi:hypothetical protein